MVSVRSRANCQHHGGPGLDLDERFNIRELLLAPSEECEPKVLTRLEPKGNAAWCSLSYPRDTRTMSAAGVKAETYSSSALLWNTVNPISRLFQRQALPQGMLSEIAGKGCWRKRMRPCNAVDSGYVSGDLARHNITAVRKHAHFQRVVYDEKVCRTTSRGNVI